MYNHSMAYMLLLIRTQSGDPFLTLHSYHSYIYSFMLIFIHLSFFNSVDLIHITSAYDRVHATFIYLDCHHRPFLFFCLLFTTCGGELNQKCARSAKIGPQVFFPLSPIHAENNLHSTSIQLLPTRYF